MSVLTVLSNTHLSPGGLPSGQEASVPLPGRPTASLNPVLIFGTGLTRQLVPGDGSLHGSASFPQGLSHLVRWDSLLQEVAYAEGLAESWAPNLSSRPTLLWDELVRARVALMGGENSPERASQSEQALRRRVAQLLKDAVAGVAGKVDAERLHSLLMMTGAHLVSLNFDTLPVANEAPESCVLQKHSRTSRIHRISVHGKTIWYPHGCVLNPRSIRLGLRDYGLQSSDWDRLFRRFKAFERRVMGGNRGGELDAEHHSKLVTALLAQASNQPDLTLMGHLLLAPLVFFGVGLSETEWGWWWLMNQRARNLARIAPRQRPPAVILKEAASADAGFWACKPAGISPLFVPDWPTGWRVLRSCPRKWCKSFSARQGAEGGARRA